MAHTEQFSEEDRGMRLTCYVICVVAIAICFGVLLYVTFL